MNQDTRDAAREAARRSGKSLSDWLDGVIAETASRQEVPPRNDHRAEMEAIAAQLARISAEPTPETRRAPMADPDTGRPGRSTRPESLAGDPKAAIRQAVADITRRQADLDRTDHLLRSAAPRTESGPGELRSGMARATPPTVGGRDPFGQPPSGDMGRERGAPLVRREGRDLSTEVAETFATFSRDLHEAIQASDVRPQVDDLDRQVRRIGRTVEGISAAQPPNEALLRIDEQTRAVRDLLSAAAERSPSLTDIEGQVAKLEARLGTLAAAPQGVAPDVNATLSEVRSLLDSYKPGAALSSLEQRIGDLTRRIERGLESGDSAQLIEGLSRRVDEIHSSLRSQLADAAVDTRPLEGLVRGIAERLGQAREASSDFAHLETAMRDVAARIESAAPYADREGVQAVEAQISRLADRLDRSESSLKALDGVEHSLGELFSQFEVTRQVAIDAAETAARTAARDTLRAALQTPALTQRAGEAQPGLGDQVVRSIDDLRALHDQADRRNQSLLSEIHLMMDRLVRQVSALGGSASAPAAEGRSTAAPAPVLRRPDPATETAAPAKTVSQPAKADEPILSRTKPQGGGADLARAQAAAARATEERASRVELDPADMLIEPGFGRGQQHGRAEPRFDPGLETGEAEEPAGGRDTAPEFDAAAGPASFIAAARRAARAAQASAATTTVGKAADRRPGVAQRQAAGPSTLQRAKAYLAQQRRPILLSLAALVLLVGALEVVKLSIDQPVANRSGAIDATTSDTGRVRTATRAEPAQGRADTLAAADRSLSSPDATSLLTQPPAVTSTLPSRPPLPTFVGGLAKPQAPPADSGIGEGLRAQAAAGDAAAEFELGLRFADGRGVTRDPKQAVAWFQKAAAQGLAPAEYRLGSAFEKGVGADRDPALAMAWYGKAADAGNIRAMHNLAVMAAEGAAGKPDYAKASSWFQKASTFGVRDSQFNLAILYARGLGVEQSLAQSYTWFAIAAAEGDDDAAKKRDEVGQKLDPKMLASAKAAADAFRAATPTAAANEVAPPPGGWDAVAPHAPANGAIVGNGAAKVSRL